MTRILIAGEAIVDLHPTGGDSYERRLGGAPANVAVGLARLELSPALWARLGTGPFGSFLAEQLPAEGVDDAWLARDSDAPTGCAVVSLDEAGDRSFTLYLEDAASTRLDPARVEQLPTETLDWLHVGGVELSHEPARSAVFRLLEAIGPDVTVSFDPNYRPSLWETFDYQATLERALAATDVVVAGPADFAATDRPRAPEALADRLLADGPHTAFVTRGADGALARAGPDAPWGPASATADGRSAEVTDTTGAGDAFTAGAIGVLAGALGPVSLDRAVRAGCVCGARSVTAPGAVTAFPDRADLLTALE